MRESVMTGKLIVAILAILVSTAISSAQSPERKPKKPKLRKELISMVTEDQNDRRAYDTFRKENGLMINNKALNERLDNDPPFKERFFAASGKLIQGDARRTLRFKEIVAKYGWPSKSLVGTDGENAAYLLIAHATKDPKNGGPDVDFQKLGRDLMAKLPVGEVDVNHLASLTDRLLVYEGKKQWYGMMLTRNEKNEKVPQPIEDEAHVDERRAKIGLEPLDEYLRKEGAVRGTPAKP